MTLDETNQLKYTTEEIMLSFKKKLEIINEKTVDDPNEEMEQIIMKLQAQVVELKHIRD